MTPAPELPPPLTPEQQAEPSALVAQQLADLAATRAARDALANALADILGHTLVGDEAISAIATAALRQHAPGLLAEGTSNDANR